MTTDFDIIIVGAGMVGSALACALAPSGARIGLLERELPPSFDPAQPPDLRVSAINYASIELLSRLGAWPRVLEKRACPFRQLAVWEKLELPFSRGEFDSRFNRTCFDAKQVDQAQLGYIIENRIIQLALLEQLEQYPNIQLTTRNPLVQADFGQQPPRLTLEDGTTLIAPLVVGSDGANSRIRQWAQIGQFADAYAQHALLATVEIEPPQQDITWQAFTPTGPLAFLPLADVGGKSYASLVWYHQAQQGPELLGMPDGEFLQAAQTTFPRELPPLKALVARGSFPLVKRHALNYVKPGVALVGDAAHTINPLAGQGVNLGFKDVASLARILLEARQHGEGWGTLEVLQRYERERHTANQLMMNLMDLFYYGFSNSIAPIKLLRNLGLAAASLAKPAQRPVIAYALGLRDSLPLPAFLRERVPNLI